MAFTPTNPINTDGASAVPGADNRALGLKLYSGEVIRAFDEKNIGLGLVTTRSISGGKSSQFIVTGKLSDSNAETHTPGTDVTAKVMKSDERIITITDRVIYSTFVDDLDLTLAQYDIRSELAKQSAEALSTKIDKEIFALMGSAILTAGVADQASASQALNVDFANADAKVAGDALVSALFALNADFNAKNVPTDGRNFVTTSANYYNIVQSTNAVNNDYTNGNGGIDSGTVMKVAGTPIVWTNNLPATAAVTGGTAPVGGFLVRKGVIGVVKAMDVQSESNYIPEKLGSLLTSFYALGMDVLNPAEVGIVAGTVA